MTVHALHLPLDIIWCLSELEHYDILNLIFRITSENVAEKYGVTREKQDRMAELSHSK